MAFFFTQVMKTAAGVSLLVLGRAWRSHCTNLISASFLSLLQLSSPDELFL